MHSLKIQNRLITPKEYLELRASVDWEKIPLPVAEEGLKNTTYSAIAYLDQNLAGMGRVVGDGFIYFYIQDIIVKPEYQGQGVGRAVVESLLSCWEKSRQKKGAMMLVAGPGKTKFYEKFRFQKRSDDETSMFFP